MSKSRSAFDGSLCRANDDREAAERDKRLFGSQFDPEAFRFTPEERRRVEAMRGPGESFMDVITRLVKEMALTKRAKR
ncbi:MAG TPA: hypothetical protein VFE60_07980 [Roseiarcus sp.]|nr:hypothetical protein [Roseiarcus sp.]